MLHALNSQQACLADTVFQLLHLTVAILFAEQLQKDLEALNKDKKSDVSLAAKWAPTPASKHSLNGYEYPSCACQAALHWCSSHDPQLLYRIGF